MIDRVHAADTNGDALLIGDYVEKFGGEARWFGWIVAIYETRRGKVRVVVDIEPQGFQMIGVPNQLRLAAPSPTEEGE